MVSRLLDQIRSAARTRDEGWYGVTVSYRREDVPLVTTRVGYGKTFAQALHDADSQLSDGTWRRIVVSTPETVLRGSNQKATKHFARSTMRRGENVVIRVEKRVSVEIPEH